MLSPPLDSVSSSEKWGEGRWQQNILRSLQLCHLLTITVLTLPLSVTVGPTHSLLPAPLQPVGLVLSSPSYAYEETQTVMCLPEDLSVQGHLGPVAVTDDRAKVQMLGFLALLAGTLSGLEGHANKSCTALSVFKPCYKQHRSDGMLLADGTLSSF